MAVMGRRRKNPDSGLEARVYERRGAFYYVHRSGEWEPLGKDREAAKRKASTYQSGVRSADWLKIKRSGAVPPQRFQRN